MRIRQNTAEMVGLLMAMAERDRSGIHLTDLLFCPKKANFYKQFPQKMSDKMLFGILFHTGVLYHLASHLDNAMVEQTFTFQINGVAVQATPDLVTKGAVLEFKTTEKFTQIHPHHLLQLKGYMSFLGRDEGILLYYSVKERNWVSFHVTLTREDKVGTVREFEKRLERFKKQEAYPYYSWECVGCPIRDCPNYKKKGE